MKRATAEARRWLARAESDLAFAEPGLREGFFAIPSRYPNGLPGGVPSEVFTERQAEEAVRIARRFIAVARAPVD